MSSVANDSGKKWIQSGVALLCMILIYVFIQFFTQIGEWFELESKIPYYMGFSQFVAVLISLGTFIYILKNSITSTFLEEVYQEAIKVVWPNKNETVKHTIGIMIGVTIVGTLLAIFDLAATWLLSLIN